MVDLTDANPYCAVAQKLRDDLHPEKKRLREHIIAEPWRLTLVEHFFRVSMTFNLVLTTAYKIWRGVHWCTHSCAVYRIITERRRSASAVPRLHAHLPPGALLDG